MVEVNIPEQEPEPDIRPSSRITTQHTPEPQPRPQPQPQLQTGQVENDQHEQGKERVFSDEHAVRRSPEFNSVCVDATRDTPLSASLPSYSYTHEHTRSHHDINTSNTNNNDNNNNNNTNDVDLPTRPHENPPRSDPIDLPPAQKGDSQAPMRSILQGVTSRFTSYPNQHRHKNDNIPIGGGGGLVDLVSAPWPGRDSKSKSSPDLLRVDEKDYASFISASTEPAHSTTPLNVNGAENAAYGYSNSGPFGFKRHLHKASSAPRNDLHSRFNLLTSPSPLGSGGNGETRHVNFNTPAHAHPHGGAAGGNDNPDANPTNPITDPLAQGTGGIGLIGPIRPTKSMAELLVPGRKLGVDPTWSESLRNTVKSSYMVYLLPIVPVAWALNFSGQADILVFVFSFLAVIPLASLLSFATEQLALRMGDALGGLLNATFGNAVELLISILALVKGEIGLVQASMIGSILSNTLLVLGCCFFAGGLRFHEQIYSTSASQLQISLLGIAMCALVLPAAFQFSLSSLSTVAVTSPVEEITDLSGSQRATLLSISRGVSFMLLSTYAVYLVFQLYTHAYLFKRRPQAIKRPHHEPGEPHPNHAKVLPISEWVAAVRSRGSASSSSDGLTPTTTRDTTVVHPIEGTGASTAIDVELGRTASSSIRDNQSVLEFPTTDDDEEEEKPLVKAMFALALLLVVTGVTGVTAEFLVGSIDGVTESTDISREFVGLILLPIVGNIPETVCAITVSIKDKLDLSLSIAVGSTIQVALGILPLLVLVGWAIGQPMSLFFDAFQIISLAVSLIIVAFAISDGRSCFAEGYILIMTYFIFALCSWYYDPSKIL